MPRLHVSLRFDPTGAAKLSLGTLEYMRPLNRQRAYELVRREFQRSGISQVELASRLGKPKDAVAGLLNAPKNWDLDTVSDLLCAISGQSLDTSPRIHSLIRSNSHRMLRSKPLHRMIRLTNTNS
jgi:hypothetical protein